MIHPIKWFRQWKHDRKLYKFRKQSYPVCILRFPSGTEMVLIRNTTTHNHSSGGLLPISDAEKEWGADVIQTIRTSMREVCADCACEHKAK